MDEWKPSPEQRSGPADISNEFLTLDPDSFSGHVRRLRSAPVLSIVVDITGMENGPLFIDKMRKLKAFVEQKPTGQERSAKVFGRKEQRRWGANVFFSGVEFEEKE